LVSSKELDSNERDSWAGLFDLTAALSDLLEGAFKLPAFTLADLELFDADLSVV
jgi:hypothetical protein